MIRHIDGAQVCIRRIFALLHSGEVRQAHGPSWLVFRIAKVLVPQNGDRIAGECIWA